MGPYLPACVPDELPGACLPLYALLALAVALGAVSVAVLLPVVEEEVELSAV